MRCLARVMRFAMVSSGRKGAGDFGCAQGPDGARGQRDGRAGCQLGASSGWQHMNSSSSESS
jgi:hypothetical protein